jgi:pre-mRNA-processing factor 8
MEGNFFGTLSPEEIEKKAKKWRQSQKRRFNEKRRRGGGAGIDMGKAVSGLCPGGVRSVPELHTSCIAVT